MKQIHYNKKAGFNYHLKEEFMAGIVLEGWEAKSLEAGRISLEHSYVRVINGEVFLVGAEIAPLPTATVLAAQVGAKPDATRFRKLLLNKREINKLIGAVQRDGFTIIPVAVLKDRKFRLKIALAKGKNQADKRKDVETRDVDRELQRLNKAAQR